MEEPGEGRIVVQKLGEPEAHVYHVLDAIVDDLVEGEARVHALLSKVYWERLFDCDGGGVVAAIQ